MQNIKVIIGASYGDEGKGLAADFFGAEAETALSPTRPPGIWGFTTPGSTAGKRGARES